MGNIGTLIILKSMCEYNLQINLNGLKQQFICDVSATMCKICSVY